MSVEADTRGRRAVGSPAADAGSCDAPPPARRVWRGRHIFGIDALVFVVIAVPLALGLFAHARWGYLFPPDSRYYTTMTYRDMGASPSAALSRQWSVTGWTAEPWYFSSTAPTWHMVQSRMLYPLLSVPFVQLLGDRDGMAVVPTLGMAVAVLASTRLVQRLFGPLAALAAGGVFAAAGITFWLTQAITDPIAIGLVALILLRLPLGRRSDGRDLVWLGILSVLLCMTRQVTPMIVGAAAGAWLWAAVFPAAGHRRFRGPWAAPAAVIAVVSLAGQVACSLAYPYDASQQFLYATDQPTLGKALARLPALAWSLLQAEGRTMVENDHFLAVLMVVPVVYLCLRFRDPLTGMFVGGTAGTAVLCLANGIPSGMRYESVMMPVACLLLGATVHRLMPVLTPVLMPPGSVAGPRGDSPSVAAPTGAMADVPAGRRRVLRTAAGGAVALSAIIGWSATHGSRSMVGRVPTSPSAKAAVAGSGAATTPAAVESADLIVKDAIGQAASLAHDGSGFFYAIADWQHPLRYRPTGSADPGQRSADGTAVVRFGDLTGPQQHRLAEALSLNNTLSPATLRVVSRRTSAYGEDVRFVIADEAGRLHHGHATVLYPTRPSVTGTVTELVFDR